MIILSFGDSYRETLFRLPGFVSERVTTRLLIVPVLWLALAGAVRADGWSRRSAGWFSIVALIGGWFLALQLLLRAQAWRPHTGPPAEMLPAEVLKTDAGRAGVLLGVWIGAVVSLATALTVASLAYRRRVFTSSSVRTPL